MWVPAAVAGRWKADHADHDYADHDHESQTVQSRHRDAEALRSGLEGWLRAKLQERHRGASGVSIAPPRRPSAGLSGETLLVDAEWSEGRRRVTRSLVVRLPPAGDGLFPTYDLSAQAALLRRLSGAGLPVARPFAYEPDPAFLGAGFLVVEGVEGRVLGTSYLRRGWLHDSLPQDQARLHRSFLEALATLHRADWGALGLSFISRPGGPGLGAEIEWWSEYLEWASGGSPHPVLADALRWCRASRPDPEPPSSLLWGDVQFANAVFDNHMRLRAILDWELASIAPPEQDLGWHLALHRLAIAAFGGDLPGFPGRAATIAQYEGLLGRKVAELRWFEVFALARSGAILARIAHLLSASGEGNSWLTEANPQIDLLARILESEDR